MKLELKHLCAYLPYGLEMIHEKGTTHILTVGNFGYRLLDSKPILRPLSDLTRLGSNERWWRDQIALGIERISYCDFEELLKEHYDVFNLIPEGLAVDINTIKK